MIENQFVTNFSKYPQLRENLAHAAGDIAFLMVCADDVRLHGGADSIAYSVGEECDDDGPTVTVSEHAVGFSDYPAPGVDCVFHRPEFDHYLTIVMGESVDIPPQAA